VPEDITRVEALLKRERLIVASGLAAIALLAWGWVVAGAGMGMSALHMSTWSFPPPAHKQMDHGWTVGYAVVMVLMWWSMMIAMMTPSAAPMVLLYARAHRFERKHGRLKETATPTAAFVLGYLVIWLAFSIVAAGLQWALEAAGLVHAMLLWSIDPAFTSFLLVLAGLYQLTPLKQACLQQCRSPAQFLSRHFKPGAAGAFATGIRHGLFCLGCCWLLMALLFAGGVMNLVWIAGLATVVLAEKLLPRGELFARVAGAIMIGAGLWIFARAYVL
jgi:predicted metal-binding membrane protein